LEKDCIGGITKRELDVSHVEKEEAEHENTDIENLDVAEENSTSPFFIDMSAPSHQYKTNIW